jgi:hypothetical protein
MDHPPPPLPKAKKHTCHQRPFQPHKNSNPPSTGTSKSAKSKKTRHKKVFYSKQQEKSSGSPGNNSIIKAKKKTGDLGGVRKENH